MVQFQSPLAFRNWIKVDRLPWMQTSIKPQTPCNASMPGRTPWPQISLSNATSECKPSIIFSVSFSCTSSFRTFYNSPKPSIPSLTPTPLTAPLLRSLTIFLNSHSLVNSRLRMFKSEIKSLQAWITAMRGVMLPSVWTRKMNFLSDLLIT